MLGVLAASLQWPHWVRAISPYEHSPQLPGGTLEWTPLVALALLGVVALAGGWAAYRRRDIG